MELHTDFSQRIVLETDALPWHESPALGIKRRLLARKGVEDAEATSIVRYEAGTAFPVHAHPLGEEIIVLEGELKDEHGTYSAGTYIKNPPNSSHAPYSETGCTLFVKLRHMDPLETERVVVNKDTCDWQQGLVPGLQVFGLSQFDATHTAFVKWAPNTYFKPHFHLGGEEIFVLEGSLQDEHGIYPKNTWLRSPHMSTHTPFTIEGCIILVKVGHLAKN